MPSSKHCFIANLQCPLLLTDTVACYFLMASVAAMTSNVVSTPSPTKKQDTCESELKAGEAALKTREAALKTGEAALKAREARLREELASREARLADEGVRDARMAATMQDTLKALKAELAAELEKRTQEMQNERDLALSNTRAQRDAIFRFPYV
jgi:uncharacterized protein YlxW (UPF0749 family)